ncbi:hypothetical protein Tco_0386558 [Tanacetum coccineum]
MRQIEIARILAVQPIQVAAIASVSVFSFVHVLEPQLHLRLIVLALSLKPLCAFHSVRKAISWRGVYTNAAMVVFPVAQSRILAGQDHVNASIADRQKAEVVDTICRIKAGREIEENVVINDLVQIGFRRALFDFPSSFVYVVDERSHPWSSVPTTIALAGAAFGIGKIFPSSQGECLSELSEEVRKLDLVSLLCWLMPNHLQEGKEVNFITVSIISSSSGRIETIKIQVGIRLSTCLSTSEHSVQVPQRSMTWLGQIFTRYPFSNLLECISPNYRSDPADEKENSALLLNCQTYPLRDSWSFYELHWGKSTKARQIDRLISRC